MLPLTYSHTESTNIRKLTFFGYGADTRRQKYLIHAVLLDRSVLENIQE